MRQRLPQTFVNIITMAGLIIATMTGSSLAISQSKVSDFEQPVASLVPMNRHLRVGEADQLLMARSDLVVLDLRTKAEYDKGHLANAVHVDYFSSDFQSTLESLDREKGYVVYCQTGSRSDETIRRMTELGIEQSHIIGGGYRAWKASGKEIVTAGN